MHQVWVNTKDEGKLMYTDNDGRDYEMAKLIELWQALDDEAVTTFTLDSKLSPKEQLHKIIEWHVQVATDPAVNGGQHLSDYPKEVTSKLMALLDRIETEDDHTLASQRFEILREAGFEVVFTGMPTGKGGRSN